MRPAKVILALVALSLPLEGFAQVNPYKSAKGLFQLGFSTPTKQSPVKPKTSQARPKVTPAATQVLITNLSEARPNIGVRYEISQLLNDCERISVDPSAVFRAGDRVRFTLETNTDGYMYLIARGTSGKWKYIFPHPLINEGKNLVAKGQKYPIPPHDWLRFDENPGEEEIFVVLSTAKIDPLESILQPQQRQSAQAVPESIIEELNSHVRARALVFEKEETVIRPTSATPQVANTYVVNPDADSYFLTKVVLKHTR